jgi:hypothetical protein
VIVGRLERDYLLQLKHRGAPEPGVSQEKKHPARRWVVERTHAWHNKFRRLFVRWEKKGEHYYAMLDLASTFLVYRLIATADTWVFGQTLSPDCPHSGRSPSGRPSSRSARA